MKMKYKGSRKGTRFAEIARADGVREIARMEELIRQMAGRKKENSQSATEKCWWK